MERAPRFADLSYALASCPAVKPDHSRERLSRPNDSHLLALAVDVKARYLITGDKDLLVLNPFRKIRIASPAHFLAKTPDGLKPEGLGVNAQPDARPRIFRPSPLGSFLCVFSSAPLRDSSPSLASLS
jgi:hypothetical protein